MYLQITLAPGVAQEFQEEADFFRVLDSAVNDLSVYFYKSGVEVSRAEGITAGYGEKFQRGTFDKIRIESATGGAVSLVCRLGNEVSYDKPPTGNISIAAPMRAPATQARKTVTNASQELLAANSRRNYLLIQNKDTAGNIWLNLAGQAATQANGVNIPPGGAFELNCNQLLSAIYAIGDIDNNANIVTVEA